MNHELDHLIRGAKPPVPAPTRARVLEHARAHGAVALAPAPLRLSALWRVAALIMLALGAGVVSAFVTSQQDSDAATIEAASSLAEVRAELDALSARVEVGVEGRAEVREMTGQVAALEQRVASAEFEARIGATVERTLKAREEARNREWRERHVEYVRQRQVRERDAKVSLLRAELNLTPEQEAEIVALLDEAAREAESLIGDFYARRGRRHGGQHVHQRFETLAAATEERLAALLDEQQRERLGGGIVSAEPSDWAPREDFRDGTDVDVWMNWMNVSRE